ncbi:MAG: hypothetical protein ACLUKN_06905 [Bacilli bacterium]
MRSKTLSEALGKYDALLEKYENFSESREALDAQEARLSNYNADCRGCHADV